MRVFVGGATQPGLFDLDDDELKAMVRGRARLAPGSLGRPAPDRESPAIPGRCRNTRSATSTGSRRSGQRGPRHPGLILAGNAFNGVGIPDCVRSGQDAASALLRALADPAAPAAA